MMAVLDGGLRTRGKSNVSCGLNKLMWLLILMGLGLEHVPERSGRSTGVIFSLLEAASDESEICSY